MNATATNQTNRWFIRENGRGDLDLTPEFQRRSVWSPHQRSYLIDSILGHYAIPEVYVRTVTGENDEQMHQVVDGQQRLTSILMFAANDLALEGELVRPELQGLTWDDLTPEQKQTFNEYKIVVRQLEGATDEEVRELFRRVNRNTIALNDQEIRNATYRGRFISMASSLSDDDWWVDVRLFTPGDIRRMKDVEYVSELMVLLLDGAQNKKTTLDSFYRDYEDEFEDEERLRLKFTTTKATLDSTLPMALLRKWSSKSDFYALFGAVGQLTPEDQRLMVASAEAVRTQLETLYNDVTIAKKIARGTYAGPTTAEELSMAAQNYAEHALVSTTDRARRAGRIMALSDVLAQCLQN